jgi:NPCBM/NEW2 domain
VLSNGTGGWPGPRSVALWTVIGGMAALVAMFIPVASLVRGSSDSASGPGGIATAGHSTSASTARSSMAVQTSSTIVSNPNLAPPSLESSAAAPVLNRVYLSDMKAITNGDHNGPVQIRGKMYSHTRMIYSWGGMRETEYNLGTLATRLTAMVGIPDDQDTGGGTWSVSFYGDNMPIKTVTTSLGKPVHVSIDLRGILRLKIQTDSSVYDKGYYSVDVALGDALLDFNGSPPTETS